MKIGIISDTHGNFSAVERAVSLAGDVKLWLHAGDCAPDARFLASITQLPVYGVAGNCDWLSEDAPEERVVEVGGHRIFLTHGHIYEVRYGTEALTAAAIGERADMAVYGHTHVVEVTLGELSVLNPGSAARPRDGGLPSFMTVELLQGQEPEVQVFRMEG